MQMTAFMPGIVGIAAVAVLVLSAASGGLGRRHQWLFPAAASLALLVWSLWAAFLEGPLGFWSEHTRNYGAIKSGSTF